MSSRISPQRRTPRRRPRARIDPRPSVDAGPATAANAPSRSRTRTARPTEEATPRAVVREGGAFLVWHCTDCGAVESVAAFPSSCPNCAAGRTSLSYWPED